MNPENELLWSWDMLEKLQADLSKTNPRIKAMKARVLKNIFLIQKNSLYQFQLEFIEQDIVIFDHIMDMAEFMNINKIKVENQDKDFQGRIVIPRIILKLSFFGMKKEDLVVQSRIANDIKSIFPQCKYVLLLQYKGHCTDDNLIPFKKSFDQIIYFYRGKAHKDIIYRKGDLNICEEVTVEKKYDGLINYVMEVLQNEGLNFMK